MKAKARAINEFIEADSFGTGQGYLDEVKRMDEEKKLEEIVKQETRHFPIKKILAGAAAVLTLGLYQGNAHAGNVVIQTDKGAVTGFTRGNQVFDSNGKSIGVVVNGTAVPTTCTPPIRAGAGNMRSYEAYPENGAKNNDGNSHHEDRITNVDDYLKRAGEELERGNYESSKKMYGVLIQRSQGKKLNYQETNYINHIMVTHFL
jgi:hypothetical protein